jgi:hypothetical protein
MNLKVKVFVHLPNGLTYEVIQEDPERIYSKKEFDELVFSLRESFGNAKHVSISIKPTRKTVEELVLWGTVLQNSYVKVHGYEC